MMFLYIYTEQGQEERTMSDKNDALSTSPLGTSPPAGTAPTRCMVCKKKFAILVDCACGQQFCVTHRHHECAVVRQKELENLKKNLPAILPSKLERI